MAYILRKKNVDRIVTSKDAANSLMAKGFTLMKPDPDDSQSDDGKDGLKCPHCEKIYKTQEGLDRHITEKHPKSDA